MRLQSDKDLEMISIQKEGTNVASVDGISADLSRESGKDTFTRDNGINNTDMNGNEGYSGKKLNFIQFSIMIYVMTCAGGYGIEAAIKSGGILYTLIGLMIIPFVYCLPQSLMCAELSSMMPSYHGYIIWVYRGYDTHKFGRIIGFFNAIGNVIATGLDIPIYAVLMCDYFKTLFNYDNISKFEEYIFKLGVVFIGFIFNAMNINCLGNSSLLFTFIVIVPFLVGFVYGFDELKWSTITDTSIPTFSDNNENKDYDWGLWLSTMLWLHTGWDCMGNLSSDIGFKKSKLFWSFLVAVILDWFTYTVTILGAITQNCDSNISSNCWDDGYLSIAYNNIINGLGYFIVLGGILSCFSLYIVELSSQSRCLWSLSQQYCLVSKINGEMFVQGHKNIYNEDMKIIPNFKENHNMDEYHKIYIGIFPKWLCGYIWDKTNAPMGGIILQSIVNCFLIQLDFDSLVEGAVFINGLTYICEMTAYLRLRYVEPNTHRPYKVPGGMFMAWLITIDKLLLILVLMILQFLDDWTMFLIAIGIIFIMSIWYIIYKYHYFKYIHNRTEIYQQM